MSNNQSPRRVDPSIIVGLLGFLGVIITAIVTIYAPIIQSSLHQSNQPTPAPQIITATFAPTLTAVPTDTVPPGASTSTPAPATDTPEPTFTSVAPIAIGEDWGQSCISTLWKPYPANITTVDNGKGCWKNPVLVFSANSGNLAFLAQRGTKGAVEIYGLFAPLPESGSVSIHVHLKDLSNVDLLLGVYAEPDVNSQGLLMTIPNGNVKKRVIVQKDNVTAYTTITSSGNLDQGDGFWFTFTFDSLSARSTVNPSVFVTNPFSLPSAQKWFFIGYKGLTSAYRIEGNFFGLELK